MEDELYLENIDEFVTDQNRVVTYKWLSYTLGVHVNQAKQMLYDYVERKRKENSGAQLHVVYLVAGNLVQNGHVLHKVAVVREDQLEGRFVKSGMSKNQSVVLPASWEYDSWHSDTPRPCLVSASALTGLEGASPGPQNPEAGW
ncbi:DNA polymerase delta subunit 3-like [Sphaerodactylus townsendi]|uniref:DNA polymerase delta subunit 3-like n=1 Tax=Sphaerodactylus townsendi TaxID=933632 RepID=UPI0020266277|nr:DNA polymerase delta subunit 3-like [Sphaerodactylus townsendi]